jgi:tetratricopeptide (TPR) repeat protein
VGKTGRNELCPCGSSKKYKKCCEQRDQRLSSQRAQESQARQAELFSSLQQVAWPSIAFEDDPLDNLSNSVLDLIQAGRFDEADAICDQLLREYPEVVDGLMRRAEVYEAREMWAEAADYYRKAAKFARENDGFEEEGIMEWLSLADKLERRVAAQDIDADPAPHNGRTASGDDVA